MTISFVSIFTYVWITRNKSMEPLKTRQDVTPETLTLFCVRKGFINVYMVKIQVITDDYELESTKRKLGMDVPVRN